MSVSTREVPSGVGRSALTQGALAPFDGTLPYFPDGRLLPERPAARASRGGGAAPKTALFAWELGGGLGHMMPMLPLVEALSARGCKVYLALRELRRAAEIFARAGVRFLQAPFASGASIRCAQPATYAQMLNNTGFGDFLELFAMACAWRNLFKAFNPDLILFDHAPIALLAARGLPAKRVLLGSGFFNVPDSTDEHGIWATLRPDLVRELGPQRLLDEQDQVLARVNKLLDRWHQPPLDRLGQIYSDVDENFLGTLPELDPFASQRDGPGYFGYWGPVLSERSESKGRAFAVTTAPGEAPRWPDAPGRRVFAYLKRFTALPDLLAALAESRCPTLLYLDQPTPDELRHESPTLRFARSRLDTAAVIRTCHAAIHTGGHGLTTEMLLAGKPILEIPLAREQRLNAQAVVNLGAGAAAWPRNPDSIRAALASLLSGQFDAPATAFATRYAAFDPARQREAMLSSLA